MTPSPNTPAPTIPVTIVTGFLGSGKTTLINRILQENHGKRLAVVLNEIGDVNIDGELVTQSLGEDLKVMNNGCLCCTVRDDLAKICLELAKNRQAFDAIVIETTGMADPNPVAQTFFMDPRLQPLYHLDAVITVVDGFHLEKNLTIIKETQEQIGFADVILVNKADLLQDADLEAVLNRIKAINGAAKLVPTTHCNAPLQDVLGLGAFDLKSRVEADPSLMNTYHEHTHDDNIHSLYVEEKRPLEMARLNKFMDIIVNELGSQLLRYKGVLNIKGENNRVVFQGVHMTFGSGGDRPWKEGEERKTQMVFIGRYLPASVIQEGLAMCVAQ